MHFTLVYCTVLLILSKWILRSCLRVGKQIVDVPSFLVRVDSQKHIDFALSSPLGGGRPGRVKRKNMKAASKKASGGDGDEEEEDDD